MANNEMTSSTLSSKESLPTPFPKTQLKPFSHDVFSTLWQVFTSTAFVVAVLSGALLAWGGTLMLKWWSPSAVSWAKAWLLLGGLLLPIMHLLARRFGPRAWRWGAYLPLAWLALLLIQTLPVSPSLLKPFVTLFTQLEKFGRLCLASLQSTGNVLLGGLLFFVFLAQFLERVALLWPPNSPQTPPPTAQTFRISAPESSKISAAEIQQLATQHFSPTSAPATPTASVLWFERGRTALIGQVWLLLGGLLWLAGMGILLFRPELLHANAQKICMGTAPWLLLGAFLQIGPSYAAMACWREEKELIVWLYDPHHSFAHAPYIEALQTALQSEESKASEETK